MKFLPLLTGVALLWLGGCATLTDADRAALQQHGVSPKVAERMKYEMPLELADIMELSQKKLPQEFILRYLRSTTQVYNLTSQDVLQLRQAGVRSNVIDYLLATPSIYAMRYSDPWFRSEPYYYYHRPIIVVRDRRR